MQCRAAIEARQTRKTVSVTIHLSVLEIRDKHIARPYADGRLIVIWVLDGLRGRVPIRTSCIYYTHATAAVSTCVVAFEHATGIADVARCTSSLRAGTLSGEGLASRSWTAA